VNILILGGTGVISREIVQQLLQRQDEVTIFNRGQRDVAIPADVTRIIGDKRDRTAFSTLMRQQRFDAVIDMISYNVHDAQVTIETFGDRVQHFIFCSSVAAYKRPFTSIPTRENAESLIDEPTFLYGYHKAEMERYLQSVSAVGTHAITVIRPSLTYGIGSANVGVLRQNFGIVDRIRKGKPLVMFGDGTTPWNFTFAEDLAQAFIGAACNPQTYGKAYHATNSDLHYWQDLYLEFGRILGKEPNIVHLPATMLRVVRPPLFAHLDDEKKFPSHFDNGAIMQDVPQFKPRVSLGQGLQRLLSWYERDGHTIDEEKDRLEDVLVEFFRDAISELGRLDN
jgi:nucleoside-diphosphate-sugar epimerase